MSAAAWSRAGSPARVGRVRVRLAIGGVALALGATGCAGLAADPAPTAADMPAATSAAAAEPAQKEAAATTSPASPETLVTSTPDEHSQVGELVKGFPADLLPVPPDSVILVTSVLPVGDADVQEVSLNLRTSMTADEILQMYRTSLVAAGFSEAPAPANPQTDLAVESMFTRSGGDELVSIGVLDADGARTVTIGGRVRTAG